MWHGSPRQPTKWTANVELPTGDSAFAVLLRGLMAAGDKLRQPSSDVAAIKHQLDSCIRSARAAVAAGKLDAAPFSDSQRQNVMETVDAMYSNAPESIGANTERLQMHQIIRGAVEQLLDKVYSMPPSPDSEVRTQKAKELIRSLNDALTAAYAPDVALQAANDGVLQVGITGITAVPPSVPSIASPAAPLAPASPLAPTPA